MSRVVIPVALVLAIAVGGGGASAWYAVNEFEGFNALRVGPWTTYPSRGTPDADPYSKARFARHAELPLGLAEGLTFTAQRDSSGRLLTHRCTYRIEGTVPVARFWTLYAAAPQPAATRSAAPANGIQSQEVVRGENNSFEITASRHPFSGNWLALEGDGPMSFVLTLYDAPAVNTVDAVELELPRIERTGCDG